jgi:hypothetical protein
MAYEPIRTPDDVTRRLIVHGTREDHYLDLKGLDGNGHIYNHNHDGTRECARDVAQFANGSGGNLVLGAAEQDHVLREFQDVPDPDAVVRWIDDVLKDNLVPVPPVEPHVVRLTDGPRIIVINVPPSPRLIARRSRDAYEFPVRAGDSKRYMTLMEVEARMQNNERLSRLRLEQIRNLDRVTLDAPTRGIHERGWTVTGVNDDVVSLAIGALHVDVPLAYVQAVYRTQEPDAAWVLALSARIERIGGSGGNPEHLLVRKITT